MREVEADAIVVSGGTPGEALDLEVEGPEVEAALRAELVEFNRRVAERVGELVRNGDLLEAFLGFVSNDQLDPIKRSEQAIRVIDRLREIGGLDAANAGQLNVFAVMADPGAVTDSG